MAKKQNNTTGQYDKVFKENAEEIYEALIKKIFAITPAQAENLEQSDLQYTLERKADFLKKIIPTDSEPVYALQIEIQSDNDDEMNWRMLVYRGLVGKKYHLQTKQFVVYIGNDELTMPAQITEENLAFTYQIIDIRRYDYTEFLQASTPEEVILAVLGNFQGEQPETIISKILLRLRELTNTTLAFGKYAMQLEVISELRKLRQKTKFQIDNMPVVFDYTQTTAYETGEAKGEAKGRTEMIYAMFAQKLDLSLIATIANLPLPTIQTMYLEWQKTQK